MISESDRGACNETQAGSYGNWSCGSCLAPRFLEVGFV